MERSYVIALNTLKLSYEERKVVDKIEEYLLVEKGIKPKIKTGFYTRLLWVEVPTDKGELAVDIAKEFAKRDIEFTPFVIEREGENIKEFYESSRYKFLKELRILGRGRDGYEEWLKFRAVKSATNRNIDVDFMNIALYLSPKESDLLPYNNIELSKEERNLVKEFLIVGLPAFYPLSSSRWSKARKIFDRFFGLLDEKKVNTIIISQNTCPIHLVPSLEKILVKRGFQIWYHSSDLFKVNEPNKDTLEEIRKELLAKWKPNQEGNKSSEPLIKTFKFDKTYVYRIVYRYKKKRVKKEK